MKSRWMYLICGMGAQLAIIAACVHVFSTMIIGMGIMAIYWHLAEIHRKRDE